MEHILAQLFIGIKITVATLSVKENRNIEVFVPCEADFGERKSHYVESLEVQHRANILTGNAVDK